MILVKRNVLLVIISFIFQGAWEYIACGIYYDVHNISNMNALMIVATLGDVAITLLVYNLIIILSKNKYWELNLKDNVFIMIYAVASALYFESIALHLDRWSYSGEMVYIPGTNIGLLPVVQLVILIPLTVYIENLVSKKFKIISS